MDKLASQILEEIKKYPNKKFYSKDLIHLQSIFDIEMQMMWLYENGHVSGEFNSSYKIEYIIYYD